MARKRTVVSSLYSGGFHSLSARSACAASIGPTALAAKAASVTRRLANSSHAHSAAPAAAASAQAVP